MSETTIIDGRAYAVRKAHKGCVGCAFATERYAPPMSLVEQDRRNRLCDIVGSGCFDYRDLGSVIFVSGTERELHEDEGG